MGTSASTARRWLFACRGELTEPPEGAAGPVLRAKNAPRLERKYLCTYPVNDLPKGGTVIWVILAVAFIALLFGLMAIRRRSS
jgi:hypothetical protein